MAVKSTKTGVCQAAFYKAGEIEISNGIKLQMESQGMAMVKMEGARIDHISLADPSRKLSRMVITVSGIYDTKGEHYVSFPDHQRDNTLILVDLPQGVYAGKSLTIGLNPK